MLLTSSASIWKLIFAFVISLAIVLLVYFSAKNVPGAELISAIIFLFVYAFVVRRLTV